MLTNTSIDRRVLDRPPTAERPRTTTQKVVIVNGSPEMLTTA